MKILSWNVNGVKARLEAVNRLVSELQPALMCFQKVRKKGAFLTDIPGYFGWLGIMDDGLFGGVSTYIHRGMPFEFETQRNDMPEWLMETGCLNVIRFDQFILVNAYFPYVDLKNEQYVKDRQRWNYELHDYLVKLTHQKPVILCGDLNIVNDDIDAWDGVSIKKLGCYTEWEHRGFNYLLSQTGLVDTYRFLHPEGSFKKICNEYSHQVTYSENVKPRFYSDNSDFVLTLYNLNYGVEPESSAEGSNSDLHRPAPNSTGIDTDLHQTTPNCTKPNPLDPKLNYNLISFMNVVKKFPEASAVLLAVEARVSERTAMSYLKKLQELEVIRRVGTNRKGYWEINSIYSPV